MKLTNRKMRKILSLALAALFSCAAFGQAQIKTMKMKIADFPEKTTKVVLTGNSMTDARFRNIVKEVWTISPFEFCTLDEYESLKSNPDYYFLMLVKGQFSKESEPGIEFLSLVKGGVGASEGINGLFNVVDVPFRAAEDPDGREFILLPALLDIIQDHVLKSMDKDLEGYSGLSNYNINLAKSKGKRLVFAEQDLAADVLPSVRALYFKGGMEAMDEAEWYIGILLESEEMKALVTNRQITVVPITESNSKLIGNGKTMDDYNEFMKGQLQ